MWWQKSLPKPKRIAKNSHDTSADIKQSLVVSSKLVNFSAEDWERFFIANNNTINYYGGDYKFDSVPTYIVRIVKVSYLGGGAKTAETMCLNTRLSHIPDNAFWGRIGQPPTDEDYSVCFPGFWTGVEWTWKHYAAWLVTKDGKDFPVVFSEEKRRWYWPWESKSGFVDLNEIEYKNQRVRANNNGLGLVLSRIDNYSIDSTDPPPSSKVALQTRGRVTLIDTKSCALFDLFSIYLDLNQDDIDCSLCTKSIRDAFMTDELVRQSWHVGNLTRSLADIQQTNQESMALSTKLGNEIFFQKQKVRLFFEEAIARFDATKEVSRKRVFGEFRKFLEESRAQIVGAPEIIETIEKPKKSGPTGLFSVKVSGLE